MNISLFWNLGSMVSICLMIQLISGIILSMNYCSDISLAFNSVTYIMRNFNNGWLFRIIHANGASFFFFFLYIHVGRGLYYYSFKFTKTWIIGVLLLLLTMGTAFMGYVLPWGQMSFWGASVITNLLSAIPYLGLDIVKWIWGGFSMDTTTLTRFFTIHFMLPFIIMMMVLIHLLFLHTTGSSNPLGINSNMKKISFFPFYMFKDLMGFLFLFFIFSIIVIYLPNLLSDPDNFTPANPMITPLHIQPEWYFLFAYAILRSIPNKLGGVIALLMSILILMFLPLINNNFKFKSNQFYKINQLLFWMLISSIFLLTWIGMSPMEFPYIMISKILTMIYFSLYMILPLMSLKWNNLMK